MMDYTRSINRMLHDEHMATIALLERIESTLAAYRKAAPDTQAPDVAAVLRNLVSSVEADITAHFAFEQDELFTRLSEAGDTGMTSILQEEHDVILPLGEQVSALARAAIDSGFTEDSWTEFRRLAAELVERMIAHIQKEEMGMLAALEQLLDEDADMEVMMRYAELR
ncbi:MAG: hemerythrin domain-containing protein [Alphaproteobacteria bacterium]|nr:hemerythrin domain-containing protein [Alphaproteobacteria bacterium]